MSTAPTLDDIQSDTWHLYHLLDTIVELQIDLDGTEKSSRDRVESLSWIARDIARRLAGDTDVVSAASTAARARA